MTVRLLRALQRGGCAVRLADGKWHVWRCHDRRRSPVGAIAAADMELLRLSGQVSLLGGEEDGRLVWSGAIGVAAPDRVSAQALMTQDDATGRPRHCLLHRILVRCDPARARRLGQAARDFLEDVERAQASGRASGMNWQALAAGTRIDGGARRADSGRRIGHAAASAQRLARVRAELGGHDVRWLERLIVDRASRYAIARWCAISDIEAQTQSAKLLARLADLYDMQVSAPQRSSPLGR